ncbi:MAG TPA: hypothetical protein VMU34_02345, partial [Mycobacterium sp.]|nr:hypothetical protein [Mycobacterium sp.]
EVRATSSPSARVLVVPESVNPGWVARTARGTRLTPVTVNGWQQGWVVPAGTAGTITLTFASNDLYRGSLGGGLALLPLLALLAVIPARRRRAPDEPAAPWRPGPRTDAAAVLAAGWLIGGGGGLTVFAAALGVWYWLNRRGSSLSDRTAVILATVPLLIAGAALSLHPWRSVGGYLGHSWGVQLFALIAVGFLAASAAAVSVPKARPASAWTRPRPPKRTAVRESNRKQPVP